MHQLDITVGTEACVWTLAKSLQPLYLVHTFTPIDRDRVSQHTYMKICSARYYPATCMNDVVCWWLGGDSWGRKLSLSARAKLLLRRRFKLLLRRRFNNLINADFALLVVEISGWQQTELKTGRVNASVDKDRR
jgi:hypothetical protein